MDFHNELRQQMIDVFQISIKQLRAVLELGVQELADLVGLTRQSINNLENGKVRMSSVQYIALSSVVDHFTAANPELLPVVKSVLNSNDIFGEHKIFESIEDNSLLKKWFLCFPENYKSVMADITNIDIMAENYKIFIDSSILLQSEKVPKFNELCNIVNEHDKRLIIPVVTVNEIRNIIRMRNSPSADAAHHAMETLANLQSRGIADFRGELSDENTKDTLLSVFSKFKTIYRLALITQNAELAQSILSLNTDSTNGYRIIAFYFDDYGVMKKWDFNDLHYGAYISCEDTEDNNLTDTVEENNIESVDITGWEYI